MMPESKLDSFFDQLSPTERALIRKHILAGTSANYLSDWLSRSGFSVSASTIKQWRRDHQEEE